MIWSMLNAPFRRFFFDEKGSTSMEAILIWPLMLWAYGATFVYFDAFKAKNQAKKATYTISDTISREFNAVTPTYIDSMYSMVNLLSNSNHPAKMRITSVEYNDSSKKYEVIWSKAKGSGMSDLTTSTLQALASNFPVMPDGEHVILVETRSLYEPFMNVGFGAVEHTNLVITRPRFVAHICYEDKTLICT